MTLIDRFSQILEESKREYESEKAADFHITEEVNCSAGGQSNVLALGDNSKFMRTLLDKGDMAGKIKLIYIDPPFFSSATYDAVLKLTDSKGEKLPPVKYFAYDDVWKKDMSAYLTMLCKRMLMIKDLLAEDGTVWVHLDWHVVHYVKVFLDEIFGSDNFVNEIIWNYKSGGSGKRHFAKKHDTILVYGKSKKYYFAPPKEKSYNRGFKPYRFKGVKEYKDDMGWYTMVTMKDVWHVDMVGRTSAERTGYATQKPESLVRRIIECATKEGDLCADFFCGSGTLGAAACQTGRRWFCCDGSPLAVSTSLKRLSSYGVPIKVVEENSRLSHRASDSEGHEGQAEGQALTACRADIEISRSEIAGSDKELIKIELKNYSINVLPEFLEKKGRDIVEEALKDAPLSLLEFWSVDFNYDGRIFRPEILFSRKKGVLDTCCEKLCSRPNEHRICVKTVDVFGNCAFKEVGF